MPDRKLDASDESVQSIQVSFRASASAGDVSALLVHPDNAQSLLVFAHGAGAGMNHPFMESLSGALARQRVATFRYQFPYMENNLRRPDFRPILLSTVQSAVMAASEVAPDLPLFAGGKSMGGRMTSLAFADRPIVGLKGLIFVGFPLHPMNDPTTKRAHHLDSVDLPMLFLQGTRDKLANLDLMLPVTQQLGSRARLHLIDGADHSFHVLKRSGRTDGEVIDELARLIHAWTAGMGEG